MNRASSATGWVRNPDGTLGWTWNPLTGCLNHVNGMCKGGMFPCYAYKLANGRLRQRYLADSILAPIEGGASPSWSMFADPFYPRFWPERLIDPITDVSWSQSRRWGKQASEKGIFVCDMGELFGDWIPRRWQEQIFETIKKCPQHRFYLLTKQPQNLIKFSPFPDNCWVGVTVTGFQWLTIACQNLRDTEARVKFLSLEPLLERMNVSFSPDTLLYQLNGINWVIIGAQTKPYKPPKIEWVEEIVRACDKASVPVFLKDNLAPLMSKLKVLQVIDGQGLPRMRGDYTLRQELPK